MRKLLVFLALCAFFLSGCSGNSSVVVGVGYETNIRSEVIYHGGYGAEMHYRNVSELMRFVNDGRYNTTSVETHYDTWGYLERAEVFYNYSVSGDGNRLRLIIITAEYYYAETRLSDIMSRGYQIQDVRRFNQGDKEVIEVYYFKY